MTGTLVCNRNRTESGFTLAQLVITLGIISVVSTIAVMGISSAQARLRLANSARQFATYVERTRADAVRRHDQSWITLTSNSTYSVSMDFASDGTIATQSFALDHNVNFITQLQTVSFDWRGRTENEISVGFANESGTANVNITGSGDVTIDSEIFHDASVPRVTYNVNVSGDIAQDTATPEPIPNIVPSPIPSPNITPTPTPSPTPSPTPTPTPHSNGNGNGNPTPTPTPIPTPTATPTPTPTPAPTPQPCSIVATPNPLTVMQNGSGVITVTLLNSTRSNTIVATSSNQGQIQVSPTTRTASGSLPVTFTVTVKKTSGTVAISSPCGSKTVTVTVP
jgi:type II secretory pathway pseudopilin PulG